MLKSRFNCLLVILYFSMLSCEQPHKDLCKSPMSARGCNANNIQILLCGFDSKVYEHTYIRNALRGTVDWDLMLELSESERIHRFNTEGYLCLDRQELVNKFKVRQNDTIASVLYVGEDYLYYFDLPINSDTINLPYAEKSSTMTKFRGK